MKTSLFAVVLVSAVSVLMGCSGSSTEDGASSSDEAGSGSAFACDVVPPGLPQHRCAEFASMPDDLRSGNCADDDQERIVDACPTDGLIATCTIPNENFGSITYYYYSDSQLDDASSFCTQFHGTLHAAQ